MIRYKQLKLNAKMLIRFCEITPTRENKECFKFDLQNKAMYNAVVQDTLFSEDCALFHQLAKVLRFEDMLSSDNKQTTIIDNLLYRLVVVDFASIYNMNDSQKEHDKKKLMLEKVKLLIENGFVLQNGNKTTHFMPFDKSENMNRQSRITFIDNDIYDDINKRLNIGIDFGKIAVTLSKYYAYRGLYLSTSQSTDLVLDEETVVILKDNKYFAHYQKNTPKLTAQEIGVSESGCSQYAFFENVVNQEIEVPYDGQGFICPEYANLINCQIKSLNANSFQIRLPFAKGMLHKVDFHGFLSEFDGESYNSSEPYTIVDAFGMPRDLKTAKIIMPQSMLKCFDWIKKSSLDPMEQYFKKVNEYGHKLFVANTDIPYGDSRTSRLSYQMINTLALDDEMFEALIKQHLEYVNNPTKYLKLSDNYVSDEKAKDLPNWKRALYLNPDFSSCHYIKQQLKNTQASLMRLLAEGRLVVLGQMRYLTRDLGSMLVGLLHNKQRENELSEKLKIYSYRFFMPQGCADNNVLDLHYEDWCGFFRSPHLSRNEQCLLLPFVPFTDGTTKVDLTGIVKESYKLLNKYFGHLTGIVMVGNESVAPMALGGADFDGDLVNVVLDKNVTKAVKTGVYDDNYDRIIPYIEVPSNKAVEETVPDYITFKSINDTFSNKIGLISNAAIGIGQVEYAENAPKMNPDDITCAKCTILTGLEIDAAKHGKHPDLSMIEGETFPCAFLDFKKDFDEFSKSKLFYINNLKSEIVKEDGDIEEHYKLSIKNRNESITYPTVVGGTYINKLPQIFMDNLNFKLPKRSDKTECKYFEIDHKTKKSPEYIELNNRCKEFLGFYKEMTDLLGNKDFKEKLHNACYCQLNLRRLLTILYDKDIVEDIYENKIPLICGHLANFLKTYDDIKAFEKAIYDNDWHLQTLRNKKSCLKKILESLKKDESLDIDTLLSGEDWEFLFIQRDQGYKLLWFIVHLSERQLFVKARIEELKKHINETNALTKVYKNNIIKEIKIYDEKLLEKSDFEGFSLPDTVTRMFYDYLSQLIDSYKFESNDKIKLLFNLTKTQKTSNLRRLFWDSFSWDELKPFVEKSNKEETLC